MKNSIFLFGINGYFTGSISFVCAILAKLVLKKNSDYLIVYLLGTGISVMAFLICLKLKDDKFRYVRIEPDDYPQDEVKIIVEHFSNEFSKEPYDSNSTNIFKDNSEDEK